MAPTAFNVPSPLLARVLPLAGPAKVRLVERAGARVLFVPGRYSNTCLVIGDDAVVVVDVGSSDDAATVLRALAWLGLPPRDVRYILPSHLHFDHVMGIDFLAQRLGVAVALGRVAHGHVTSGDRLRFPKGVQSLWHTLGGWPLQGLPFFTRNDWKRGLDFGFPWAHDRFQSPLAPVLADGDDLPGLPGWRVLETPGHADDAIALHHAKSGMLVCGDTVRNFHGGEWNPLVSDPSAFAATRGKLRRLHVRTVFPGHGPVLEGAKVLNRLMIVRWFVP